MWIRPIGVRTFHRFKPGLTPVRYVSHVAPAGAGKCCDRVLTGGWILCGLRNGDGNGLWLLKRPDGGGQWSYQYSLYGRRKELGLGSLREKTLRDARIAAEEVRRDLGEGRDLRALTFEKRFHLCSDLLGK
ncbi:Arm DNA-binding domain-containing protein [Roseovarius dicentrarchi]|uniref:Arm DNA-binding domain-containing protein n=1 Tax=Roseovarius dicentrarchi TaxID=2250573 RepID=UPI001EF1121D|nr:Arm DNA-binding domain-containing protein [Roseovarius dicentrarchi]